MLASLQRPLSSHRYLALASRISFPTCMGPCVCRSLQVVTWGCCCDGLSSTCSLTSIIETTSRFTSPRRLVRRRTRPGCGRSLAAGFGSKTVGHPTRVAITLSLLRSAPVTSGAFYRRVSAFAAGNTTTYANKSLLYLDIADKFGAGAPSRMRVLSLLLRFGMRSCPCRLFHMRSIESGVALRL